jgi:hypothetical protein
VSVQVSVLVLPTLLQKFLGTFYGLFAKLQTNDKNIHPFPSYTY